MNIKKHMKKGIGALSLIALLATTGCDKNKLEYDLGTGPTKVKDALKLPGRLAGDVYVKDFRSDLNILYLKIEGTNPPKSWNKESKNIPEDVRICPKSKTFELDLGERCYFVSGKGIVELYWGIKKDESEVRHVILNMNAYK